MKLIPISIYEKSRNRCNKYMDECSIIKSELEIYKVN